MRKVSAMTLAVGLVVGALPGIGSAAGSTGSDSLHQSYVNLEEVAQQAFISPEINTQSNNKIRVIVQLDGQPEAAEDANDVFGISSFAGADAESTVQQEQSGFLDQVSEQGLNLEVNYQYDTVLNGFEVSIPANQIPKLANIPGVKAIQENSTWYPDPIEPAAVNTATSTYFDSNPLEQIGVDQAWAAGYSGKGLKVGVLDTGVDYKHPDIAPAYKGGYDSFYDDNDPYEDVPDKSGYLGTFHGTHVAGTIIGRAANTNSDIVQKGVAYEADLYAYKVLGKDTKSPDGASGTTAQVIDGIERAVQDGMDVINMSLSSESEMDVNSPYAIAINNAVLSGVTVVVSSGNEGPGSYTLGSPAAAQLAIAVGAVDSDSTSYSGEVSADLVDAASVTTATYLNSDPIPLVGWKTLQTDFKGIMGTDPQEVVYAGLGRMEDYVKLGSKLAGKVVLVSRGGPSLLEKVVYANQFGAKAVVVFNGKEKEGSDGKEADLSPSIPGYDGLYYPIMGDGVNYIPTFVLSGEKGRNLAKSILENSDQTLKMNFKDVYVEEVTRGDFLAPFSAWGPNSDADSSIKPDLLAPGVNIMSTIPTFLFGANNAYQRSNGTSMSAPHISGMALLLKQAHPDWNPFDIRAALANTAVVLKDERGDWYSVYQQGAGRADANLALQTRALLQAIEPIKILDKTYNQKQVTNYNSSASFGMVSPNQTAGKTLQLKNVSGQAVSYTASVDWHGSHSGVDAALDNNSITAAAGSTSEFKLNLTVADSAQEGFYSGQVTLSSPGEPTLHLPFSLHVGYGIQDVKLTNDTIYPNQSGKQTTNLSLRLTASDTNYIGVYVESLDHQIQGILKYKFTDSPAVMLAPGVYQFDKIDYKYQNFNTGDELLLPEGQYRIIIQAIQLDSNNKPVKDSNGNEIVYTAYTYLRVDYSGGGGNSGGGTGGGGPAPVPGPGTPPAVPTIPNPFKTTANVSAEVQAVINPNVKTIKLLPKGSDKDGAILLSVQDDDLEKALSSAGSTPTALVIAAPAGKEQAVKVSLTANQLKQLGNAASHNTVVINANGAAISLPAKLFAETPANAELEVVITPAESSKPQFTIKATGSTVIGTPVNFEANWVQGSGSKTPVKVANDTFIKRSFTIPGQVQAGMAGVLYEENGVIKPVASIFKAQQNGSTIVTVSRPGFSVYAAVSRTLKFNDIANSPAASHIEALAGKFIIEGTSADKFSPMNPLTRAEFTSLLVRSLGLTATTSSVKFSDVKASDWYAADLAAAYEAGLIQGTGNHKFSPSAKVTRQELIVILDRALELTGVKVTGSTSTVAGYADESRIAGYAKDSVHSLSSAGIISGIRENGKSYFKPNEATTRETAASALRLMLAASGLIEQ